MKKALIIGGSSDIGRAVCSLLQKEYEVVFSWYSSSSRKEGGVYCDIRSPDSVDALLKEAGPVDLLVTSSFPFINSDPLSFNDYRKVQAFLDGHMYLFSRVKEYLNPGGRVVNILGQSADNGLPSAPHYGASFAYLENFSRSINSVYGRKGLFSFHNILLGPVETRLWQGVDTEERDKFEKKVVSFLTPEQVADEVLHIARSQVAPTKYVLDGFYSLPE